MSKLGLMQITYAKLAGNREFIASYLENYIRVEGIDRLELMKRLQCSEENFYRLALCKTPLPSQADFHERVEKISAYASVPFQDFAFLILSVYEKPYLHLDLPVLSQFVNLIENKFKQIYTRVNESARYFIPEKIRNISLRVGQLTFSTLIILIFVLNFTEFGKGQNLAFYRSEYPAYKDSIERISVQDNTQVKGPFTIYN
ncbi:MAG: hypothetical protein JNL60_17515 [Bacteroidia bacterium]|nr:hypothetical protein [Bacteroidia bacterium]